MITIAVATPIAVDPETIFCRNIDDPRGRCDDERRRGPRRRRVSGSEFGLHAARDASRSLLLEHLSGMETGTTGV